MAAARVTRLSPGCAGSLFFATFSLLENGLHRTTKSH